MIFPFKDTSNEHLMNLIRRLHSGAPVDGTEESLQKHRVLTEQIAKLATPIHGIAVERHPICGIPAEIVKPTFPHRTDRIILYCHGGGFTNGGLGYAGILAGKLALSTGMQVVTFAYSLAPEAKYPQQQDETETIWNALLHHGVGARQIMLAGDSAGGNLVLELCLRLKNQGRLLPRALILFSPWTDMRCSLPSCTTKADADPIISPAYLEMARTAYAPEGADFSAPEFSPLLADLSGLPPMLIQVGENEMLRDDSKKLAQNVTRFKGRAKLEVYPKGWHVFQQMPVPLAATAMESVYNYVLGLDNP